MLRDLRYGLRLLWQARGFSAVSLIALALGTGATTAIFSVVDAVLLKPLPFRDPERLLVIYEKNPAQNKFKLFVAPANYFGWRASRALEGMAAIQQGGHTNLTGGPGGYMEPEELRLERASATLFPLLGVQPLVGRVFMAEEDQPGRNNVAVLSYRLWQRRFGADARIAGRSIRLREQSYTVAGVMPRGFGVLDQNVDVWLPLALNPSDARTAGGRVLTVIARLKPGITREEASRELETIGDRLEQASPALNKGWRPSVFGFSDELFGEVKRPLLVLLGAVGFLLLIACVNVANLLLARGSGRRKEIAIRTALGASRGRVVRQLLSESVLLSLGGGALGLGLALGGLALAERLGPASIPRLAAARLDARVFLFALAISVATGLLFGIAPALQASGTNLREALVEGGRGGTMSRRSRALRAALVVSEVALAVVVLIGAGLLMRSFVRLRAVDPGFQASNVLTFRLPMQGGRGPVAERRLATIRQLTERLSSLPGVRGAGAVSALPLSGLGSGALLAVEGRPTPPDQRPIGLTRYATAGYFRTMGIPLLAGRMFTDADNMQSPSVVLVSQTLARRLWPEANAVGGRLVLDESPARTVEVIGVVGDVKANRLEGEDWATVYTPYAQVPAATMTMAVRTAGDPLRLAAAVRNEVHRLEPNQPVADLRPMESVVEEARAGARFNTAALAVFAAIAFLLAAVGIYGVIAYDVSARTHEIGIRLALGAQGADVLRLVLLWGARLAAGGIAIGLAGAFALTRLMASMLYGVKATDAYTFALIAALLGLVALGASYLPSRRAVALDPVAALRHE